MASRTERIEARIDLAHAERIRYASALVHTSLSGLVVAAAAEKAEPVPELAVAARREREQPRFRRA
jgi:uncharacterized protein (DUF1778 family)